MKFELEDYFNKNFELRGECGASLVIWKNGVESLSLHRGWANSREQIEWNEATLVPVWSASKGPAVATLLLALDEMGLDLSSPVSKVWPELRVAREKGLSFAQLLSHQSGLAALEGGSMLDARDPVAVVEALEEQMFEGGGGEASHAYHPRTFGYLLNELVQRLSGGMSLSQLWQERIARPMHLEFYFGLPEALHDRVARLYPAKQRVSQPNADVGFATALRDADSLSSRAFASPGQLQSVADMNSPETWRLELPAWGGIGNASSLAKFYSMLAMGGIWEGRRIFSHQVVQWLSLTQVAGFDQVLQQPSAFSAGMMKGAFGEANAAFGHPGAGGSLAFADPETGTGFAYVMNQMTRGVFPDQKTMGLVDILNKCNSV